MLSQIRFLAFLLVSLLFFPYAAVSASDEPAGFRNDYPKGTPIIKAATRLAPIQFVVDRIGGEYVDSISVVPPGFDSHTFEPKPSQLKLLNQADVYFSLDTPLEQVWIERFVALNSRVSLVNLMSALKGTNMLLADTHEHFHKNEPGHEHADEEHEHAALEMAYDGHDSHVWMSPYFLKLIAGEVCKEFSRQLPQQAAYFEKNLAVFNERADELGIRVRALLKDLPESKKTFLVFHPSWAYFAKEFGLTQLAVEQEGKEPTPAYLAMIIDDARNKGISVIFVQKEFNPAIAATVAAHLPEGRVVTLDPASYDCFKSIEETAAAISGKTVSRSEKGE